MEQKKKMARQAAKIFQKLYPRAWCTLNYKSNFQLLISVILSAQCTDARINLITPHLFSKYPTPQEMAKAPTKDLEKLIRSSGFYKTKSRNIKNTSKLIVQNFSGKVPSKMNELLTLHGVARKTSNIILFHAYGKNEGIAVDTHCMRISHRLGFTSKRHNQSKTEKELMQILPKEYWGMYTNWMVLHGRKYCMARKPDCKNCPLNEICLKKGI